MNFNQARFQPLYLGEKVWTSNRLVVPAMASQTADANGHATAATLAHYARLATSGAGLVLVEYSFVHRTGRSEPAQLSAASDEDGLGLRGIAAAIRGGGSIPGLQLTHAGGKSTKDLTDGRLMGPSGVAVPIKDGELEAPATMTLSDILLWKAAFVDAAARAVAAGFAVIELHAAHGYGLNQWLSPLTNRRCDEFGGSVAKRSRLLLEIVREIRLRHPGLVISVRVPGQEHFPGGLSTDDATNIAILLIDAGVDIINVSSGIGGWRRPKGRNGEGYLVDEAAILQRALPVPVIGVGGIETAAYIEEALARRQFSLAAVGRAILADPVGWRQRHLTQKVSHRLQVTDGTGL